jgi:hypothetical protein
LGPLLIGIVLGLMALGAIANLLTKGAQDSANATGASVPTLTPPSFRVFRQEPGLPVSIVVAPEASDEQIRSLLWFFRSKVRAGDFKTIGITQATAKQWGQYGYTSGMLVVYRGTRCANEGYISDTELERDKLGPCGYGEHDDASYQWGLDSDPYKDEAEIIAKNGDVSQVFDYKDGWHAPSEGLQGVSEGMKEEWNAKQQEWEPRQRFAVQMTNVLVQKGIDIHASANEATPTELDFRSKLFAHLAFQESFINDVLPDIRRELCDAGFRTIRVLKEPNSDTGRTYALRCK